VPVEDPTGWMLPWWFIQIMISVSCTPLTSVVWFNQMS